MILYHAITIYHILKFCIHKLRNHPNDEAILLVPTFLVRKPSGATKPYLTKIFDKVYFFNWEKKGYESEQEIISAIDGEIKKIIGNDVLSQISEVNVARAAFLFSNWLIHNKVYFQWFEEADGRLSQPEPIMKDDLKFFPLRYELAVKNGMYTGNNPYITRKYIRYESQLANFHDSIAENFDVIEEMKHLSIEDKERLLQFFDVPQDEKFEANESVLMMTQHFSNLNILSYVDHALCYQLTTDYFLDGYTAYYKWHPTDLMPYPSFIENVQMIDGQFPAELMTLIVNKPFEIGASINSTGILNLKSICKRILTFDQDYLNTFWHNHQYFFAVKLMELFPAYEVVVVGMNRVQLENMCEFSGLNVSNHIQCRDVINGADLGKKQRIYLIENIDDDTVEFINTHFEELTLQNVLVFLNCKDEYECYPLMKKYPFIVKEIRINNMEQNCLRPFLDCKRVVIFASGDLEKEKIKDMKYTKRLLNTGAETVVFESMDKDLQIAALNGMLKATEKELMKYVKENEDLRKELKRN